jgi:hypothetical protein
MKKLFIYSILVCFMFVLLSCSAEKKEVLYQIPPDLNIKECSVIFSNDHQHFAFIKEQNGEEAVVHDGTDGRLFTTIEGIALSPDGKSCAYLGVDENNDIIIKDGKEIAKYKKETVVRWEDRRKNIQFLEDGSCIYTIKESKKMKKIMKGGKPIDKSPFSSKPEVSRDGKHLLYWGIDPKGDYIVFDGKKSRVKGLPLLLSLSGNGEHYGLVVKEAKHKNNVIIDGKKELTFDSEKPVEQFILSNKGSHFILVQRDTEQNDLKIKYDGTIVAIAKRVYSNSFAFSSDDNHYAFLMIKPGEKKTGIFFDGEMIPSFDPDYSNINDCYNQGRKLVFSPDNEHILYAAGTGSNQVLAIDNKIYLRFDLYKKVMYQPFFSAEKELSSMLLDKVNKQLIKVSVQVPEC